MNSLSELGSRFKGRALMKFNIYDCENPLYGAFPAKAEEVIEAPPAQNFEAWFDISYVCNLLSDVKDHKIVITWGETVVETSAKIYNRGVILYFERVKLNTSISVHRMSELPDIVVSIYNCDTKKHIAYTRLKPLDCMDLKASAKLIYMDADKAVCKNLRDDLAGCMKIRAGLTTSEGWAKAGTQDGWEVVPAMSKNLFKKVYIFANIFQAKNLVSGDDDGLSDPVLSMNHFGTNMTTMIFPRTLNPVGSFKEGLERKDPLRQLACQ